jgi:predicted porin
MNKKLITLVVAAAMVAPLAAVAETTLYGRIDVALSTNDIDELTFTNGVEGTRDKAYDGWNMRNETTRIGVKGSEDLGNGLKAIFQAEWAFEGVEGGSYAAEPNQSVFRNRLAYAGLSGKWGTTAMGRQWTPYFGAVNKTDIYNKGDINPQFLGTSRTGNAWSYKTPNWKGFTAAGIVTLDNGNNISNDSNKGIDLWQLAANYDNESFSVGLAYSKTNGSTPNGSVDPASIDDKSLWGVGASYTFQEMFKLIGQYESGSFPGDTSGNNFDASEWTIAGEGYWGNNIFRASYAAYGQDIDDLDNFWGLGWQYNFSKRTRVYAEYFNGTAFGDAAVSGADFTIDVEDGDSLGFGVRHYF